MNETEFSFADWLRGRFSSAHAEGEWSKLLESSWDAFMSTPLGELVPWAEIEALFLAYACPDQVENRARLLAQALPALGAALRVDDQKPGGFLPDPARDRWLDLVSRPGLIDPAWLRTIFKEQAVEAVLVDTLQRVLHDFSTLIPRMIQNHLPLGRLGKIGGSFGTRLVEEIEKLLEPEIRHFLDKGARRALEGALQFSVEHIDDPSAREFRRNLTQFALEQPVSFHTGKWTDEIWAEIAKILALSDQAWADSVREADSDIRKYWAGLAQRYQHRSLKEVFEQLDFTERPPLQAWSDVTWPVVALALDSPVSKAWFEKLAADIRAFLKGQ